MRDRYAERIKTADAQRKKNAALKAMVVLCVLPVIVGLAACTHQAPQRPSQRKSEVPQPDSAQLALMELNQQLALAADRQLAQIVQAQETSYALYEDNVWMAIQDRGDEDSPSPQPEQEWRIAMRIYALNGQLYMDSEGTYRIGKHELPQGVEDNIGELHRGGKARMYVPWYAAYGISGTAEIPPYENIVIDIELK